MGERTLNYDTNNFYLGTSISKNTKKRIRRGRIQEENSDSVRSSYLLSESIMWVLGYDVSKKKQVHSNAEATHLYVSSAMTCQYKCVIMLEAHSSYA